MSTLLSSSTTAEAALAPQSEQTVLLALLSSSSWKPLELVEARPGERSAGGGWRNEGREEEEAEGEGRGRAPSGRVIGGGREAGSSAARRFDGESMVATE